MNSSKSNAYIDFIFINWEVCRYRVQNTYMYGIYPKYYYFHCCCCCWIGAKKKATSPVLSVCLAKFPTLIILPTTTHLLIKLIYLPLTTHVGPQQLRRSQTVYIYIYVCLHLRSRVLDQLVLSLSKGKVIYLYTDNHACFLIFYSIFFYFIRIGLVSGSSLNRWEAAARDVRPMINE